MASASAAANSAIKLSIIRLSIQILCAVNIGYIPYIRRNVHIHCTAKNGDLPDDGLTTKFVGLALEETGSGPFLNGLSRVSLRPKHQHVDLFESLSCTVIHLVRRRRD